MTLDANDVLQQEGSEGLHRLLDRAMEQPPEPPPEGAEPLHCPRSESSVVGTALTGSEAADALLSVVSPADFYDATRRAAWEVIDQLRSEGRPVDPVAVSGVLSDSDTDPGPLDGLRPSRLEAAQEHARRVRDLTLKRRTRNAARKVAEGPEPGESGPEYADRAAGTIGRILAQKTVSTCAEGGEILDAFLKSVRSEDNAGIRTSLNDLHELVPRFRPGELVVVAGRPGHGKTSLMRRFVADTARERTVAVFPLEEAPGRYMGGVLSQEAGVRIQAVLGNGTLEEYEEIDQAREKVKALRIRIDDSPQITPRGIASMCRALAQEADLAAVVVDYLQLLRDPKGAYSGSRHLELQDVTRRLKLLALELDVTVFLGSQLSRDGQRRGGGKRPKLHQLRDSGAIEADADVVLGVYRLRADQPQADWARGIGEIIVLKQRAGGRLGTAIVGHRHGFYDLLARGEGFRAERYKQAVRGPK